MAEDTILTGPLEETSQWYAIAKIAGVMMCQAYRKQYGCDFITAQPINLFGPGDNFDLEDSHVIPGLMRKSHAAKLAGDTELSVWGTGKPQREFLFIDDCADALVFLMTRYSYPAPINIGPGEELTIKELAETLARAVGFEGVLTFDADKPDGTPRKSLDSTRIRNMGWTPTTSFTDGLALTYEWFLANMADA